jgi:hypothetical protein
MLCDPRAEPEIHSIIPNRGALPSPVDYPKKSLPPGIFHGRPARLISKVVMGIKKYDRPDILLTYIIKE